METEVHNKSISKANFKAYLEQAISYNQYQRNMAEDLVKNDDLKIKEYIRLNQQRMHRVEKTYTPSAEIVSLVKRLKHKVYWLILTEHWCGDASQILPVLHAIAELSDNNIEMKLVYRDQNDELMDAYLTNGTKSIPKLIQLDEHYQVIGIWGPRPTVAQKLVQALKANPQTAANYAHDLHLWYAKNKQQELEKEVTQLLFRASLACPDCIA